MAFPGVALIHAVALIKSENNNRLQVCLFLGCFFFHSTRQHECNIPIFLNPPFLCVTVLTVGTQQLLAMTTIPDMPLMCQVGPVETRRV